MDDQALSAVLRGQTPPVLRRRRLATTGLWYVRLCQAVFDRGGPAGALSGPFELLPDRVRTATIERLLELPDDIALPSLRQLAPTIGSLRARHKLNLLGIEALAAAIELQADVFLSASSPKLEAAIAAEDLSVRFL